MKILDKILPLIGVVVMLAANVVWLIVMVNSCGLYLTATSVAVRLVTYRTVSLLKDDMKES